MTTEQVIEIARGDAIVHGYDISLYQPPKAEFESTDREYTWVVSFGYKSAEQYLSVVIDERTGERGFVDQTGWPPTAHKLKPMHSIPPNQSLEPTAGRRTERLKDEIMKDKVKGKLLAASGG